MSHQLWFRTRSSVLMDTKYSVFFFEQISQSKQFSRFGRLKKVSESNKRIYEKKINSKLLNFRKTPILTKIFQNLQFSTFLVTVVEISNKHFCKLDKVFRNFPSWQKFVFVTV